MSEQTPTNDTIREFVIAGHGNLPKVQEMLTAAPELLNVGYYWAPTDVETAVQAAAHVGSVAVAEFLLGQGAPLAICTAAMLGRQPAVEAILAQDPDQIRARGAHGIPLLTHAALSGNVALAQLLVARGATEGASYALGNAVSMGHVDMARWLLDNRQPNLGWKNWQEKTLLQLADEAGQAEIAGLLREHGAG